MPRNGYRGESTVLNLEMTRVSGFRKCRVFTTIRRPATVSNGGWGLREGLMVVALGLAGVPPDAALSVSILFGLAMIVAGLPGGVLWLSAGGRN